MPSRSEDNLRGIVIRSTKCIWDEGDPWANASYPYEVKGSTKGSK